MSTFLKSLVLMLICCCSAQASCPESDQIHCRNSDRCTRVRYICDGDNDCGDNSDEHSELCQAWRNSDCERNSARCRRNGRSECVTISQYCTVQDPPCEGNVDQRLCQMLRDERIQYFRDIIVESNTTPTPAYFTETTTYPSIHYSAEELTDEFKNRLDSTIRHKDCDQLYTKIGEQCVSIFFMGSLSWMESRAFCQAIGGDLLTISDDLSNFITVLQHFRINQITNDFWIGGLYKNSSVGWQWVDDNTMPMGSPFWAVRHSPHCLPRQLTSTVLNTTYEANGGYCYQYQQAPETPSPAGQCASINFENYYYVTDENCMKMKSPLCALPLDHPKQGI